MADGGERECARVVVLQPAVDGGRMRMRCVCVVMRMCGEREPETRHDACSPPRHDRSAIDGFRCASERRDTRRRRTAAAAERVTARHNGDARSLFGGPVEERQASLALIFPAVQRSRPTINLFSATLRSRLLGHRLSPSSRLLDYLSHIHLSALLHVTL